MSNTTADTVSITRDVLKIVEHQGASNPRTYDTFEALGLDSLDTLEIVMCVEEDYGVEFTDEEVEELVTVQDVIDTTMEKVS